MIGIIGGGQLARMLMEAADGLKIPCEVYAQKAMDSASFVSKDAIVIGSLTNEAQLDLFFKNKNALTFENEFLDIPLFQKTLAKNPGVNFLPTLAHLAQTQDKLHQKKIFQELNIPTAEFKVFAQFTDFLDWTRSEREWSEAILKWSRFGYDGKGNYHYKRGQELAEVETFFENGKERGGEIYAEPLIPFQREIAIQATYGNGVLVTFPVVISEQKDGICQRVFGPAAIWDVPHAIESQLQTFADLLARKFGLEGTFAIEAFELEGGKIIVNEIAPRVHNTGHATQSVCDHSQFDLHIRAVAKLPLPVPELQTKAFAMLNIIGPDDAQKLKRLATLFPQGASKLPGDRIAGVPRVAGVAAAVTWYDKEPRPKRKLGHVNLWSEDRNTLKTALARWEDWIYHG